MKTASAKAKGIRLEMMIADSLREANLDKNAKKMPRSGAFDGFRSDIFTFLPISIEAKNQETWEPLKYMEQAKGVCGNKMPIVIMSKNRLAEPLALLGWNDLVALMQYARNGGWAGEYKFSKRKQCHK